MPLIRVEVRNEYGLGAPELYREANQEDPKEVLDGVAVAGLIGILRQLGDLAEFAAEVFHGLQEEVMITTSRSHKLMARVQHIEAALSPVEKAVLAQRSHLHYAYTAGSNWHPRIRCQKNHFVYGDVPQFIMDSYEDCRGLPSLHLLDKFDSGGPGSCQKRYSDPSFFKRASAGASETCTEKIRKDKKRCRIKRKGSSARSRKVSQDASFSNHSGRTRFTEHVVDGQTSRFQTVPTCDATLKSDVGEQSHLGSRNESDYIDSVFHPSYSMQFKEMESKESFSSPLKRHHGDCIDYDFLKEKVVDDDSPNYLSEEQTGFSSFSVIWDGKTEMLEPKEKGVDADDDQKNLQEKTGRNSFSVIWDGKTDALESKEKRLHVDDDRQNNLSEEQTGCSSFSVIWEGKKDMLAPKERDLDMDDDGQNHSSEELAGYGSLSYIWNEKTVVLEPKAEEYDHDEDLESSSTNFEKDSQGVGSLNLGTVDQVDVQLCNEYVPTLTLSEIQLDDVESETDNYVDALNTIDSEPETDIDCMTKKAGLHDSRLDDETVDGGSFENGAQHSDGQSINFAPEFVDNNSMSNDSDIRTAIFESPDTSLEAYCCSDDVIQEDKLNSISSEHTGDRPLTQKESKPLETGSPPQNVASISESLDTSLAAYGCTGGVIQEDKPHSISSENNAPLPSHQMLTKSLETESQTIDGPNKQSVVSRALSFNIQDDNSRMPMSKASESQQPSAETSSVTSVKFWTNGSLLGLEPSKPPDFSVLNALTQGSLAETNSKISTSCQSNTFGGDADEEDSNKMKTSMAVKCGSDMGCSLSRQDYQDNEFRLWETSGKCSPVKATTAWQENKRISSRMFEIGNKLILNGPDRNISPVGDEISVRGSYLGSGVVQLNNHQKFAYETFSGKAKGFFGGKSATPSPSSSPPLEHMKISFQPIDGFETSKLKLKFRDGNSSCESSRDAFPLFQLVPETSVARYSVGLDSDDDTFYRSSPSGSDDSLSHYSEMNSEQWESFESPSIKDHDLYGSLRRISLSESGSTTLENGRTFCGEMPRNSTQISVTGNSVENSQLIDLPSFDSLSHTFKEELRNDSSKDGLPEPQFAPMAPPPPLPPVQWRAMNPNSYDVKDSPVATTQAPNHAFLGKLSASTAPRQPKLSPVDQDQIIETANVPKSKINGGREGNMDVNGKSVDEKEDFLYQIRTKSFNLRPTVASKPANPTGPASNGKVTAILEKANAIRQVVGSDDGEDDNWSDP